MKCGDLARWAGNIRVMVRDENGAAVRDDTFQNLITDAGLNALAGALMGTDAEIKYVAVGTDGTAPGSSDEALGAEIFRKPVTVQSLAGTGEVVTIVYLAPADANDDIEEIGWFAGVSASATPDSGILVARVLYSHTKTAAESIQIERTDTVA